MGKIAIAFLLVVTIAGVCFAQSGKPLVSFEQLFPSSKQLQMGLHRLTAKEKEALRSHAEVGDVHWIIGCFYSSRLNPCPSVIFCPLMTDWLSVG